MNEIGQGLTLSGIGILTTFSALGILILLILLLKFLFPERGDDHKTEHLEKDQLSDIDPDREELRKKAAAAGVAVILSKNLSPRRGSLGSELEKPVGNWWQQGIDRIQGKE